MTWIRLEDDHFNHPGVIDLPPQSSLLFIAGLCYSRHYLTDGFIPNATLPRLCAGVAAKWVAPLIPTMWTTVDGGWQILNYERYQQTKEEIEAQRASGRDRAARHRARTRASRVTNGTEVEEEKDNPPKSPQGDVVCIQCSGRGVIEYDLEPGSYIDCPCKTRRTG